MADTAAIVNLYNNDNVTVSDAFQFGTPGDTSWSFVGMTFKMEIKAEKSDVSPLLTITSSDHIVVDDVVQRVLHLSIPESVLQPVCPPAEYVYDLVMIDGSVPPIRTALMQGKFVIRKGVTED